MIKLYYAPVGSPKRAAFAARLLGVLDERYPNLLAYAARLEARPALAKAVSVG